MLALIKSGANLNTADKTGVTPLQVASRSFGKLFKLKYGKCSKSRVTGREMLAFHLLNHGAYVHQADFKVHTVFSSKIQYSRFRAEPRLTSQL